MLCSHATLYTKSACIIIHGTWAKNEKWHSRQGDFFKAVENCNYEYGIVDEVFSFQWSGKLGFLEHCKSAQMLVEKILSYDWVILIGHSHGVSIGILASQIIAKRDTACNNLFKIKKFYALGCPVDKSGVVVPNMSIVEKFYNMFSFGDLVQPINLACDRCFAQCDRLVNLSVLLRGQHPNHVQMHHPIIGRDILKIDDYLKFKNLGNFIHFSFQVPGQISFFEYELPRYEQQLNQQKLLEVDKTFHKLATWAFFRSHKTNMESNDEQG